MFVKRSFFGPPKPANGYRGLGFRALGCRVQGLTSWMTITSRVQRLSKAEYSQCPLMTRVEESFV